MQLKISVVKGSVENKFTAKFATSIGGGQDRLKDVSLKEISDYVAGLIDKADKSGYVGKK